MSEDNENKKSGLTAGGVSGTKKMRLGRVHKKKTEDAPETPAEEVKVEVAAPAPAPVEAAEEKPAKKTAAKKAAASEDTAEEKPAKKTTKKAASEDKAEEKPAKKTTKAAVPKAEKKAEEPEKKEPEKKAEVIDNTILGATGAIKINPYLIRVNTKERIMINKPVFKIGKATRGVDYRVSGNGAISRQHAVIIHKGDSYYIKDNKSTNHTYVNDVEIADEEEVLLKDNASIRLGDEDFTFRLG